jgi:hypothetical protein
MLLCTVLYALRVVSLRLYLSSVPQCEASSAMDNGDGGGS